MNRITFSQVSIVVYIVIFLATRVFLAAPGWYVPYYALMCAVGVLVVFDKKRAMRLWAIPMVLVAAALVVRDWHDGLKRGDARVAAQQVYIDQLKGAAVSPATAPSRAAPVTIPDD